MKNPKTPGQVVVIITLFLAVLILLSIVIVNIAKISDIKTMTSQVADQGALALASQWSQYCNVMRQTIQLKADAASLWGIGCNCSATQCSCINWGLLLPLAGLFVAIVLMVFPPLPPAGILLAFLVINPLLNEVNNILRGGFSSAAAQFTIYSSMRESSIASMLKFIAPDDAYVNRTAGDVFTYTYADGSQENYDLTDSPVAALMHGKNRMPRQAAWYWSKRYPQVTEAGLGPVIETFVQALIEITEFNVWNSQTWMYEEISLKVDDPNITCSGGECPDWAVSSKAIDRIIGHVRVEDQSIFQRIWQLINSLFGNCLTNERGFLPQKLTQLTTRLKSTIYSSYVTWDNCDIVEITEALRGIMLRDMELLNLPVAHRIPTLNTWLPNWYNRNNPGDPDTIYGRLGLILNGGQAVGINEMISQLGVIIPLLEQEIPKPYGDTHWGLGDPVKWCHTDCINCCPSDCPCRCCGSGFAWCTWDGRYCSSWPNVKPPTCIPGRGDVYFHNSDSCSMYAARQDPCYSACGRCPDTTMQIDACRFQGLFFMGSEGPTEVEQAKMILEHFRDAITALRTAIQTMANDAYAIMYPNAAIQELQRKATYGWNDKNDNLHVCRVELENYPTRDKLPYIWEGYEWAGLWKVWRLEGQTSGTVGDISISSYSSDIDAAWWKLRYRRNPSGNEYDRTSLFQTIRNIQNSGNGNAGADGVINSQAISSEARGYYGMNKNDIRIERLR